jgi:hypothetical protein
MVEKSVDIGLVRVGIEDFGQGFGSGVGVISEDFRKMIRHPVGADQLGLVRAKLGQKAGDGGGFACPRLAADKDKAW